MAGRHLSADVAFLKQSQIPLKRCQHRRLAIFGYDYKVHQTTIVYVMLLPLGLAGIPYRAGNNCPWNNHVLLVFFFFLATATLEDFLHGCIFNTGCNNQPPCEKAYYLGVYLILGVAINRNTRRQATRVYI